ncbi:MAG: helix-turn-helix transcriptional regulator [Candidatus Merdivicinus sp.]
MEIPASFRANASIHRSLNQDPVNGVLSCGFLVKSSSRSDRNLCFPHYGALLLLDGRGEYVSEDGHSIPLEPGMFVQRMPGIRHSTIVEAGSGWLEFFVCFGRDFYETMASLGFFSRQPVLFPGLSEGLIARCGALMENFRKFPDEKNPALFLEAQEFVLTIMELHHRHTLGSLQQPLRDAAKILCTPDPDYPTPAQAAAFAGMEYETFRKKFRKAFGIAPNAYQLQHRLDHSKELLLNTTLTVEQIALQCHFSDAFAFSKAFRLHFGLSPRQFRNSHL